jgi:hypothetical protein
LWISNGTTTADPMQDLITVHGELCRYGTTQKQYSASNPRFGGDPHRQKKILLPLKNV